MAPRAIADLVEAFNRNLDAYRSPHYKEAEVRTEFIDPFFEALGWDVQNRRKYAESYKEVIHEPSLEDEFGGRAPDYSFRPGGQLKFYVEAKKPSVDLNRDPHPAHQLRMYGWTKQLPVSILTNFAEFAVYDCRFEPAPSDVPSVARVFSLSFNNYLERWDEISSIFTPEAVFKGSFDRFVETRKRRGAAPFDERFLDDMEEWRKRLAENIALRNTSLPQRDLNYCVQQTIDRIVFLRICEARGIEPFGRLRNIADLPDVYANLVKHFRAADDVYNSGLFHFRHEQGRDQPDRVTPGLQVDDAPLKHIVKHLYWPQRPYAFEVVPADILGQVYERFLGKVIHLTSGHRAEIKEKPEVKKAGGVYYTPTYIVNYIVKSTVGELLEGKNSKQATKLRILDPACGSGSFLLGAYEYLLNWFREKYVEAGPEKHKKQLYYTPAGWKLTINEKKEILLNNIFGVDIDPQAVEVTKLSLLLKVLEGESEQTAKPRLIKEPALPDLDKNIKCGNSLIGPEFFQNQQMMLLSEDQRYRINAFNWITEFNETMSAGGFDAVIGNPPYGYMIPEEEQTFFKQKYRFQDYQKDNYLLFMERTLRLLVRPDGLFGMIIPNPWLTNLLQKKIRRLVTQQTSMLELVHFRFPVFRGVTVDTEIVILKKTPPLASSNCLVRIVDAANQLVLPAHSEPITEIPHNQRQWALLDGGVINIFLSATETELAAKCSRTGKPLSKLCDSYVGIKPYQTGKGTPRQTAADVKRRPFDASEKLGPLFRPYLRGADIQRYRTAPLEPRYLKYGPWLAEPRPSANFNAPVKILMRQTGDSIIATIDRKQYLCLNNMHVLIPLGESPSPLYILGVLNSRLINWYYHTLNPEVGEALAEVKKTNVEVLPVATPTNTQEQRLAELVKTILSLNQEFAAAGTEHHRTALKRQIDGADQQIDEIVYDLYSLSAKERSIVEGKPGTNETSP